MSTKSHLEHSAPDAVQEEVFVLSAAPPQGGIPM